MRPYTFLLIMMLLIGLLAVSRSASSRGRGKAKPSPPPSPTAVKESFEVDGFGLDEKQAVDNALAQAAKKVQDYLRAQDPPFHWLPDQAYVQAHLLKKGEPERRSDKDQPVHLNDGRDEDWKCWAITVRITHGDYDTMRHKSDLAVLVHNQLERSNWLARIVGLLITAAVVVFLYLRIEERTKGYYSRLLFFGAVTTLILVSVGLFLLLPSGL